MQGKGGSRFLKREKGHAKKGVRGERLGRCMTNRANSFTKDKMNVPEPGAKGREGEYYCNGKEKLFRRGRQVCTALKNDGRGDESLSWSSSD